MITVQSVEDLDVEVNVGEVWIKPGKYILNARNISLSQTDIIFSLGLTRSQFIKNFFIYFLLLLTFTKSCLFI